MTLFSPNRAPLKIFLRLSDRKARFISLRGIPRTEFSIFTKLPKTQSPHSKSHGVTPRWIRLTVVPEYLLPLCNSIAPNHSPFNPVTQRSHRLHIRSGGVPVQSNFTFHSMISLSNATWGRHSHAQKIPIGKVGTH